MVDENKNENNTTNETVSSNNVFDPVRIKQIEDAVRNIGTDALDKVAEVKSSPFWMTYGVYVLLGIGTVILLKWLF